MRSLKPLFGALGALALSLIPAIAPAAQLAIPGPMQGNWELTLHAKTTPFTGEKPYFEKIPAVAAIGDTMAGGPATIAVTGLLNGFPFMLNGYRVGKHFVLYDTTSGVLVMLSGDTVVPKSTGVSKTLKGRGTLVNLVGMSDFTITGKRTGP
jgi:hypothetical protein